MESVKLTPMTSSGRAEDPDPLPGAPDSLEQLPPSIALAWGLRDRGVRGPKPGLTPEGIAQTGIALADRDGLDAVSMARLAAELGVGTMSLYRYVASKEELLTLMVDAGLGRPQVPADVRRAGWRGALEWWAASVREAYGRHPWSLKVPITAPPLGPNNVAWMEAALDAMADTPLSEPEKISTLLLISGFVRNDATLNADIATAGRAEAPMTYGAILSRLADPQRFPAVHRAIASGTFDDEEDPNLDADFGYGLGRILDGVDAFIRQKRQP